MFTSKLHIFLTGIAIALLRRKIPTGKFSHIINSALQLVSILLFLTLLFPPGGGIFDALYPSVKHDITLNGYYLDFYKTGSTAIVVYAFSVKGALTSVFANVALRKLGAWSFSIYLLHEALLGWLSRVTANALPTVVFVPVGVGLSIVAAALSYHYLEIPLGRRLRALIETHLSPRTPASADAVGTRLQP